MTPTPDEAGSVWLWRIGPSEEIIRGVGAVRSPVQGGHSMSWWAWLAVVLVAVAIIVVGFLVVQARRRGGGVIATARRKDKGGPQ